jgi:hypothetical protein
MLENWKFTSSDLMFFSMFVLHLIIFGLRYEERVSESLTSRVARLIFTQFPVLGDWKSLDNDDSRFNGFNVGKKSWTVSTDGSLTTILEVVEDLSVMCKGDSCFKRSNLFDSSRL